MVCVLQLAIRSLYRCEERGETGKRRTKGGGVWKVSVDDVKGEEVGNSGGACLH